MKTIAFILIFFIAFAMSCNILNDNDGNSDLAKCDFHTSISGNLFANAPNDPLTIIDLEINGNCLKITFSASGCDGNTWEIKLIDSERIIDTHPVQRNLRLSFKNNEECTAFLTQAITFDISDLQIPDNKRVSLNIVNSGDQVLYEY